MTALVGRERELEALRAGLRDRADTALLVIEGTPGIGKTRILRVLAADARHSGARVLAARGSELERELGFGVVRQLLEPAVSAAALSGAAALAAPALDPQPRAGSSGFAVLHGLYWLVANLAAATPLVLCVDDLHWADAPSLRALAYLLTRIDGVDAQLCVAVRPHEPGADEALIAHVLGAAPSRVVRPRPLDEAGAAALVRGAFGGAADEFCAACHIATGGNPLLLTELVWALGDAGVRPDADQARRVGEVVPDGLTGAVRRRIERVAPEAPAVAQALAVLGDDAEPAHVAALAEIAEDRVAAVLDGLARAGLLARAQPAAFAHPLVRAAVAGAIPAAARRQLQRDAAHALAAAGAEPERLAAHLLETGGAGDAWVVGMLRAAAATTAARGAPEAAARLLRRALAEPPPQHERPALLFAAGSAEAQAGDPRAAAHLREAAASAEDPQARVEATLALTSVLAVAGEVRAGIAQVQATLATVGDRPDLRLRLDTELVNLARVDVSTRPLALDILARLDPAGLETGSVSCMLLANHATEAVALGDSRERSVGLAERALAGGWLLELPFLYGLAANALSLAGHNTHARAAWDDFIAHARARGDVPGVAFGHAFRACAGWRSGALSDALADAELALDVGPAHGFGLATGFAVAFQVEALVLRGELVHARAALERAPVGGEQLQDALLLGARGRLHLAEGRTRQALEELRAVGRLLDRWQIPNAGVMPWRADAVLALAALGADTAARELAERDVKAAERWGDPWLLGQALRAAAATRQGDDRRAALERAVGVLGPSEARLELSRALVALGTAQRLAGAVPAARDSLREALDLATRCAAPAVAEQARTELLRAGARPRRAANTGRSALTATEERVAQLAAGGAPNRAIAQRLFVTEKTVETHLSRAYRKLGIRSRAELASRLSD